MFAFTRERVECRLQNIGFIALQQEMNLFIKGIFGFIVSIIQSGIFEGPRFRQSCPQEFPVFNLQCVVYCSLPI